MPDWFMEALRDHEFTEEEKDLVVSSILKVSQDFNEKVKSLQPTAEDLNRRYDL